MDNRLQSRTAKIVAAAVVVFALSALVYWVRATMAPRVGNADEGEFLLVEAGERELDGAPALILTFTLPLDARQPNDKFLRVFEMPAPPRPADQDRIRFDED